LFGEEEDQMFGEERLDFVRGRFGYIAEFDACDFGAQ
jgi:hypothetical protein